MSKYGNTGVTESTPKNIMFGAGTIHKNLKYTTNTWNFDDSIIGATKGGSKLTIAPKFYDVEPDGANVLVKGMKVKVGEEGKMEINFLELTKDILASSIIGKTGTSTDTKYDVLETKANIEEGDYFDNISFVGKTLDGRNIIVIMENALCTSGFSTDTKNAEAGVGTYTFECHADLNSDMQTLPIHIYYPKPVL